MLVALVSPVQIGPCPRSILSGTLSGMKTHVLEGTNAGGSRLYSCGRVARASAAIHHVGRAHLAERFPEVTCIDCQKKYPTHFPQHAHFRVRGFTIEGNIDESMAIQLADAFEKIL